MKNRIILALMASSTLIAGPAAAGQRWGNGPLPDSGACFYENPNFRGRNDRRDRGESNVPGRAGSTSDADAIVRRAYQDLLRRDPDAGGLQQYRDKILRDGWSDAQVRASIMESPEYRNAATQGSRG